MTHSLQGRFSTIPLRIGLSIILIQTRPTLARIAPVSLKLEASLI